MTASRTSKAAKTTPLVEDLSGRCSATVCFPVSPYLHVRCLGFPGHEGKHNASTEVPTEHVAESSLSWRKPEMTTVALIWGQA